jgi:hypothetical protein
VSELSRLLDELEQARATMNYHGYRAHAVNALPTLVAALRRVEALADEIDGEAEWLHHITARRTSARRIRAALNGGDQ